MTRQPFSPIYRGRNTGVGPDIVANDDRLAALIGKCAHAWTWVDIQLALTMGSMLGVENRASVAVFASLRNSRAQRDALKAAAGVALPDDVREVFDALMNIHAQLDSARNEIVHGVWGYVEGEKDAAIWLRLQDFAAATIDAYHAHSRDQSPTYDDLVERATRDYFVYPLKDIEEIVERIRRLAAMIGELHARLRYGEVKGAGSLRQLYDEPLLQKELERMRSLGGKTRSAPPEWQPPNH